MIKQLIEKWAPSLHVPTGLDSGCILWALYYCEKYDPHNRVPRFEKAYAPGGYYYKKSEDVRKEYEKWGNWAACSFSNFQILFNTARELGYDGPPLALDRDEVAMPFIVLYLNIRIFKKGATTPEEVADAYNSGTFKDANKPEKYMAKFRARYDKCQKVLIS